MWNFPGYTYIPVSTSYAEYNSVNLIYSKKDKFAHILGRGGHTPPAYTTSVRWDLLLDSSSSIPNASTSFYRRPCMLKLDFKKSKIWTPLFGGGAFISGPICLILGSIASSGDFNYSLAWKFSRSRSRTFFIESPLICEKKIPCKPLVKKVGRAGNFFNPIFLQVQSMSEVCANAQPPTRNINRPSRLCKKLSFFWRSLGAPRGKTWH